MLREGIAGLVDRLHECIGEIVGFKCSRMLSTTFVQKTSPHRA